MHRRVRVFSQTRGFSGPGKCPLIRRQAHVLTEAVLADVQVGTPNLRNHLADVRQGFGQCAGIAIRGKDRQN